MRRIAVGITIAVLLAGSRATLGQAGHDPFIDHSDTGEIIHVLPPPAAIHSPHDTNPTFATPSNQTTAYAASYGSGNLLDHGGSEIGSAAFQAVYWNSSVANSTQTMTGDPLSSIINWFVNGFADGSTWDNSSTDDYAIIQQYGSTTTISTSLTNLPMVIDRQQTQRSIADSKIQSYLAGLFNAGKTTAQSNVIYGIYLPAGMKVTLNGGSSCSTFCGYHSHFAYGSTQVKYAVFPYLNCSACKLPNLTVGDMMTIVASHEIREAVTDPVNLGVYAWYDASGYEADDKCAWHNLYQMSGRVLPFWVQPEYSNGGAVAPSGFTYPSGCIVPNR